MKRRRLFSVKEVAAELGVSADTVRRAYWKGELPAFRICNTLRFDLSTIHRVMRAKALSAVMKADAGEIAASRRRKGAQAGPINIDTRENQSFRPERHETILDGLTGLLDATNLDCDFLSECEALSPLARRLVFLLTTNSHGSDTLLYPITKNSVGAATSHTNGRPAKAREAV